MRLLERKVGEIRPRVTQQMQALQSAAKSVDLASETLQVDAGILSERLRSSERDECAEQLHGPEREAELQAELGRSRASAAEYQSAVELLSVSVRWICRPRLRTNKPNWDFCERHRSLPSRICKLNWHACERHRSISWDSTTGGSCRMSIKELEAYIPSESESGAVCHFQVQWGLH